MLSSHASIFFEVFFNSSLPFREMPFHNFCIGFSLSLPSLFSKLHTHIEDTRSHMLDRCEFYLKSRFCSFCMSLKYLQNQVNSIPALGSNRLEEFVDIINLAWLEDIPKNQKITILKFHLIDHLIHLSTSYIGFIVWNPSFLNMF